MQRESSYPNNVKCLVRGVTKCKYNLINALLGLYTTFVFKKESAQIAKENLAFRYYASVATTDAHTISTTSAAVSTPQDDVEEDMMVDD